jgi:hypothetical protein
MFELGIFVINGKRYIGHFISESKTVELFGPLQDYPNVGAARRVFNDTATSEEDARKKINDAIKQGKI